MDNAILILGNGFDKSLGLPTTYQDFINSQEFKELIETDNFIAKYTVEFSSDKGWEGVETDLIRIENYIFGDTGPDEQGTYDKEYLFLVNKARAINSTIDKFREKYIELIHSLHDYLFRIENENILNFESLGYQVLESIVTNYDVKIYTFNYTSSVNKCVSNIIKNTLKDYGTYISKINYVHGSLDKKNIIFGVSDKSISNDDNSFLLKSHWRTYGTSGLKLALPSVKDVFIFGFSLGKTDHDYFKYLFTPQTSGKNFHIFYFDEESYQFFNKMLYLISGRYLADIKNNNKFIFIKCSEIEEEHKAYYTRNPKF